MAITTAQIRGARGILNWSQSDLADRTGISATSIGSIEKGQSQPRESTLKLIKQAFEDSGIEFIGTDGLRQQLEYVKTYEGPDEFKEFMDHVYEVAKEEGGDFVLFNAYPPHWHKWLGEEWFEYHSERMRQLGPQVRFKIIAKEGITNLISKSFAEYRWISEELFNDRALYAYANHIAFVNFEKDKISVIVLTQKHFADAFKILFNIAWDNVATPVRDAG